MTMENQENNGPVTIFYTQSDQVRNPGLLARYRALLTKDEIQKTDRYRFARDRQTCLVARAMVRYLIGRAAGLDPASLRFRTNAHGKPFLDPGIPGLSFNLSHSGGMVVCALALGQDLGVDVEAVSRQVDLDIADRFFSPQEAAQVRQAPAAAEQKALFFDFWTLKEAYIKAQGRGLAIPLDSFSFDLARNAIRFHGTDRDPGRLPGRAGRWRFFRGSPAPGFKVAAALRQTGRRALLPALYHCIPLVSVQRKKWR